ncbi:fluoride efflux transporter FluC [Brevibacterium yomogidense]|uniref:fluoride efflux transporter FluC n=1 Tax=Brevibacterium yomogidense TaxID=946573 RepID=UPI0018DF3B52|nr:CrcB family protein [Brevibacterium yomogidense]
MTPLLLLTIGIAGGLGAVCRFVLDGLLQTRARRTELTRTTSAVETSTSPTFPWPTIAINISGSFLLGLVVGVSLHVLPAAWSLVAGTGFLGGYTTFSTASVDAVQLARAGRWAAAAASAGGVLLAGTAAAGLGLWAGALLG